MDDIIAEIRKTREAFAAKHNYDVYSMMAELRELNAKGDRPVVTLPPRRPIKVAEPADDDEVWPEVVQPL